jgi:hypothetical protein
MTQTILTVYSNLLYSVDLRENPMFAGVKQGSPGNELTIELGLRAHIDLAIVEPAVDHHRPLDLAHPELCGIGQDLDHNLWVATVAVVHGQEV